MGLPNTDKRSDSHHYHATFGEESKVTFQGITLVHNVMNITTYCNWYTFLGVISATSNTHQPNPPTSHYLRTSSTIFLHSTFELTFAYNS